MRELRGVGDLRVVIIAVAADDAAESHRNAERGDRFRSGRIRPIVFDEDHARAAKKRGVRIADARYFFSRYVSVIARFI